MSNSRRSVTRPTRSDIAASCSNPSETAASFLGSSASRLIRSGDIVPLAMSAFDRSMSRALAANTLACTAGRPSASASSRSSAARVSAGASRNAAPAALAASAASWVNFDATSLMAAEY